MLDVKLFETVDDTFATGGRAVTGKPERKGTRRRSFMARRRLLADSEVERLIERRDTADASGRVVLLPRFGQSERFDRDGGGGIGRCVLNELL